MNKPSFVISCPIDTYSGYGARARDIVKAIINTGRYDVKILPQRWGDTPGNFLQDNKEWDFLVPLITPQLTSQPDIWMQITIPSEFSPQGKYNIGCTAGIESTGCDPAWIEGLNRMDMNWVSSNHSKTVFSTVTYEKRDKNTNQPLGVTKLEKPIEVVFEGLDLDVYKHIPNEDITLNLDAIKESFCYLFVGHWMQGALGHDRKNVGLTIKYFFDAFKNQKSAPALILKASTGRNSYMSREAILDRINIIKSTYKNDTLPNVYILNGGLSDIEMNELYNHPKVKAMVSFTKGEGYGRPLSEFGLSKKPIIASGWSGHLDFLNPVNTVLLPGHLENVDASAANQWLRKDTQWFQVSEKHAVSVYKDVYKNYKKFAEMGKKQGFYVKTNFSYEKMAELVDKLLLNSIPEFPKHVELVLPTLTSPKL
jgi:hypothetical protein